MGLGLFGTRRTHCSETGHVFESGTSVSAFPQAMSTASAKVHDIVVVRVYCQPFTHSSTRIVPAHFERQVRDCPRRSLVVTADDGTIVRVPGVSVHAHSCEDAVRVDWVGRHSIGSPMIPRSAVRDRIRQGRPTVIGVQPVEAADICSGVRDTLLCGIEHNAGRETASSADMYILERICRFAKRQRESDCRGGKRSETHFQKSDKKRTQRTLPRKQITAASLLLFILHRYPLVTDPRKQVAGDGEHPDAGNSLRRKTSIVLH